MHPDPQHPVLKKKVKILTNEMHRVATITVDRVLARRSGVMFNGLPRVGKSKCSEFILETLKESFHSLHSTLLIVPDRERLVARRLINELMFAEGIQPRTQGDKFLHLVSSVHLNVLERGGDHYVLVIDEAHNLTPADYGVIVALYNYLNRLEICMTVVGFAERGIKERRETFRLINKEQIIARFLSEILPYYGCRNREDLAVILHAYDEGTEFPVGSGVNYTAHFFPTAYSVGFRLANYTDLFWACLSARAIGKYAGNAPLEHTFEAIRNLFEGYYRNDSPSFKLTSEIVEHVIDRTNIENFCCAL